MDRAQRVLNIIAGDLHEFAQVIEPTGAESEFADVGDDSPTDAVVGDVLARIERKPVTNKVELYQSLVQDLLRVIEGTPSGAQKIKASMRQFKKDSL